MTDALTRAARAIRTFYLGGVATETGNRVESCFVGDPDAIGRSAILSFLDGEDVVEACADVEHARWSHWQAYLFSKCDEHADGSLTIPADYVKRWRLQIATVYADLSNREKESDRDEARKSLAALRALVQAPDKTQEDGK